MFHVLSISVLGFKMLAMLFIFAVILFLCGTSKSGMFQIIYKQGKIKFCLFYVSEYKYRAFGWTILLQTIGVKAVYSLFKNMKVAAARLLQYTCCSIYIQCTRYQVTKIVALALFHALKWVWSLEGCIVYLIPTIPYYVHITT